MQKPSAKVDTFARVARLIYAKRHSDRSSSSQRASLHDALVHLAGLSSVKLSVRPAMNTAATLDFLFRYSLAWMSTLHHEPQLSLRGLCQRSHCHEVRRGALAQAACRSLFAPQLHRASKSGMLSGRFPSKSCKGTICWALLPKEVLSELSSSSWTQTSRYLAPRVASFSTQLQFQSLPPKPRKGTR